LKKNSYNRKKKKKKQRTNTSDYYKKRIKEKIYITKKKKIGKITLIVFDYCLMYLALKHHKKDNKILIEGVKNYLRKSIVNIFHKNLLSFPFVFVFLIVFVFVSSRFVVLLTLWLNLLLLLVFDYVLHEERVKKQLFDYKNRGSEQVMKNDDQKHIVVNKMELVCLLVISKYPKKKKTNFLDKTKQK
jgi:hypothetical protein